MNDYDLLCDTIEYDGNIRAKLYQDIEPIDPREWDNLGTMYCWHRDYDLGDKVDKPSGPFQSTHQAIHECGYDPMHDLWLPLYLLDHSGLWMRTGRFIEDYGGWDTSHVGFIICSLARAREEYSVKKLMPERKRTVLKVLEQEVKTYSQYLEGDVYGVIVEDDLDPSDGDSCWGFYGWEYAKAEAQDMLTNYVEHKYGIKMAV